MDKTLKARPDAGDVAPLDIIFSCHVCSATFSEVYAGHYATVQGLSDGINPKDRFVTKLFLTQCCHVVCSEHLENGAPAFHPDKTRPSAPCPVCVAEKGENHPRDLYSIRGFKQGEYDEALSPSWFVTPPIKLDTAGGEMEALRFQYVNLIRFSRHIATEHVQVKDVLVETQNQLRNMQMSNSEVHKNALALKQENQRLRAIEVELQKLKKQMPVIEHHLRLVPKLTEENGQMRQQLWTLGYHVPSEPLAYDKEPNPFEGHDDLVMKNSDQLNTSPRKPISSRTADRSPNTGDSGKVMSSDLQSRPRKRQRIESPLPENNIHAPPPRSRDMMPPPKKPLSRMKSMKKLFPTIRKKFSHSRSSPTLNEDRITEGGDVQMYNNGDMNQDRVGRSIEHSNRNGYDRSSDAYGVRKETHYMTGALPVSYPSRLTDSPSPHVCPSVQCQSEQGKFTRQVSSPVKQTVNQPRGLPTEPSYIRLMDGLCHDTGLELRLQDPRNNAPSDDQPMDQDRQMQDTHQSPIRCRQADNPNRWGLGHAFLHQSPKGASYKHPDPLRSNPTNCGMDQPRNEPSMQPSTPVPQRLQEPAQSGESVVSPFFKSRNYNSRAFSRARVAERESSSIHSEVYQYRRSRETAVPVNWREPRSLNGLSFFDSPCNTENERIGHKPESSIYRAPLPQQHMAYQSQSFNSQGFIVRPDMQRSLNLQDSTYGSSLGQPSYARQTQHSNSDPFSSFSRPSQSRAAPLPSPMPSIVASQSSPMRASRSQWNALASTGVRSSRHLESSIPGRTFTTPSKNIFTSSGRRSVRR